ncbi:hypothetical protein PR048_001164 [Dryococelus australis]|uniref:DDE-1 domain-containing protein n=1 Tax=Dryococelus australis TaxID=614101 RepID=A0ABQ9IGP0_9NEOP|nr:hypothetical protein PR048_001164 [Dryococelus australis]
MAGIHMTTWSAFRTFTATKLVDCKKGAGRENTTVLACCNAVGKVLPPLIVFQGANLWSTWKGANDMPGTFYACNERGWMTSAEQLRNYEETETQPEVYKPKINDWVVLRFQSKKNELHFVGQATGVIDEGGPLEESFSCDDQSKRMAVGCRGAAFSSIKSMLRIDQWAWVILLCKWVIMGHFASQMCHYGSFRGHYGVIRGRYGVIRCQHCNQGSLWAMIIRCHEAKVKVVCIQYGGWEMPTKMVVAYQYGGLQSSGSRSRSKVHVSEVKGQWHPIWRSDDVSRWRRPAHALLCTMPLPCPRGPRQAESAIRTLTLTSKFMAVPAAVARPWAHMVTARRASRVSWSLHCSTRWRAAHMAPAAKRRLSAASAILTTSVDTLPLLRSTTTHLLPASTPFVWYIPVELKQRSVYREQPIRMALKREGEFLGSMTSGSTKLPTRPTLVRSASVHLDSYVRLDGLEPIHQSSPIIFGISSLILASPQQSTSVILSKNPQYWPILTNPPLQSSEIIFQSSPILSYPQKSYSAILHNLQQSSSTILTNLQLSSSAIFPNTEQSSSPILRNPRQSSEILKNLHQSTQILSNHPHESSSILINPPLQSSAILHNPQQSSPVLRKPAIQYLAIIHNPHQYSAILPRNHYQSSPILRNPPLQSSKILHNLRQSSSAILTNPQPSCSAIFPNPHQYSVIPLPYRGRDGVVVRLLDFPF